MSTARFGVIQYRHYWGPGLVLEPEESRAANSGTAKIGEL